VGDGAAPDWLRAATLGVQVIPYSQRPVTKHWNLIGICIFLYFIATSIYYFYIRATKTLNMGYTA
jgi:hypothetical protein